jgi:hypothetical protein
VTTKKERELAERTIEGLKTLVKKIRARYIEGNDDFEFMLEEVVWEMKPEEFYTAEGALGKKPSGHQSLKVNWWERVGS